jgi:polysaccharide deacetylase 2 family uncharacterized protein YibQ
VAFAFTDIKERISLKAFLQGLVGVALVYGLIAGYIVIRAKDTFESQQKRLITSTYSIIREQPEPVAPQPPISAQLPLDTVQVKQIPAVGRGENPPTTELKQEEPVIEAAPALIPAHNDAEGKLRAAPVDGLTEKTAAGTLPRVGDNGLTPFTAYKKPFSAGDHPVIAVAILDFGLSDVLAADILKEFPEGVSLVLSPYSTKPETWQKEARKTGHEIWMNLPLETERYPSLDDQGPQTILTSAGLSYNVERIQWALSRTQGYAGIAAFSDQAVERAPAMMQSVFKEIFTRGLGYFELNPRGSAMIETAALTSKAPFVRNHYFLGGKSLKDMEREARESGFVVTVVRPYPNTLKALKIWLDTLEQKGIYLAPLSAIAEILSDTKPVAASVQDAGHE